MKYKIVENKVNFNSLLIRGLTNIIAILSLFQYDKSNCLVRYIEISLKLIKNIECWKLKYLRNN